VETVVTGEEICGKFELKIEFWRFITMKVSGNFTIHVNPAVVPPLVLVPPSGALPDETVGTAATGGVGVRRQEGPRRQDK
jgi:hypothetical protein